MGQQLCWGEEEDDISTCSCVLGLSNRRVGVPSLNRRKDLKNRLGGVDVFRLGHLEWEMPVTVLKITGYMNFEVQGDGVRASFCWGIMALETQNSPLEDSSFTINLKTHSHVGSYPMVPFGIDILCLHAALQFKEKGSILVKDCIHAGMFVLNMDRNPT